MADKDYYDISHSTYITNAADTFSLPFSHFEGSQLASCTVYHNSSSLHALQQGLT
jgi:hypothetical protein